MSLTKEEKKALKMKYVTEQEKDLVLGREEAEGLFAYLDE